MHLIVQNTAVLDARRFQEALETEVTLAEYELVVKSRGRCCSNRRP